MPPVLIVAHGQPSDPAPAAVELAAFAARVADLLPGRRVAAATLAEPGAMAQALSDLGPGGVVFPMFMAGGWFTRVHLPVKLREAGAQGWSVLEPLGCLPALHDLAVQVLAEAVAGLANPQILLAAHGSFKSPVPSDIAHHLADKITAALGLPVVTGFIEQEPTLAEVAELGPQAVCLPFFAASGGHVLHDIPAALTAAGYQGRVLPPLGLDPRVAALVAAAVQAGQPVCAAECRYRKG